MKNNIQSASDSTTIKNTDKRTMYPILFMVVLYPLILRFANVESHLSQYTWFSSGEKVEDFFLYYKSVFLIIIGAIMAILLIYDVCKHKTKIYKSLFMIPLSTYVIFVILSTIFSVNKNLSLRGMTDQFESIWVLLSYTILFLYTIQKVKTEQNIIIIVKAVVIGAACVGIIGVLQLCHIYYLDLDIGKLLIFGKTDIQIDTELDRYQVTSTIFNPNYVGVYTSLLIPVTLGAISVFKTKTMKIFSAVVTVLLVLCTFGARSKTGLVIIALSFVIMFIIFRKKFKSIYKWAIIALVALVISFIAVDTIQNHTYSQAIKNAFNITKNTNALTSFTTEDEYVKLKYKSEDLYVKCEYDQEGKLLCMFFDKDMNPMQLTFEKTTMSIGINDEKYSELFMVPNTTEDNKLYFTLIADEQGFNFLSKDGSNGYKFITTFKSLTDATASKDAVFTNYYKLASGRGYIWSKTIPLLKDSILIGTGPDTFVLDFPQTDYASKYAAGFRCAYVNKPHNIFFQIATQTGLVSLIAFLCFYGIYFVTSLKLLWKSKFEDTIEKVAAFVLVGTLSFMISGLINDSCISVTPLFYILLGVGVVCNTIIKNKGNKATQKDDILSE